MKLTRHTHQYGIYFISHSAGESRIVRRTNLIAKSMGPTWGPSGAGRTQVGRTNFAIWVIKAMTQWLVLPWRLICMMHRYPRSADLPSLQWNNCLCTVWTYFQSSVALSVFIPKFGQAVIVVFNCLSIDKAENIVLFPKLYVTFPLSGEAVKYLNLFIPEMKTGSHFSISKIVNVSSPASFQ